MKDITPDFAYCLGALKGDGYLRFLDKRPRKTAYLIAMKVKDKDFIETTKQKLEKIIKRNISFCDAPYWRKRGISVFEFGDKELFFRIKNFDLEELLNSHQKIKANFLRGMFDAEGSFSTQINGRKRRFRSRSIYISNSDKELLKLIKKLLKDLDITSSEIFESKIKNRKPTWKKAYRLYITSKQNYIEFRKKIGSSIKRKNDMLNEIINTYGRV